jgi:tetratricopeptide (TPR) repeat protein
VIAAVLLLASTLAAPHIQSALAEYRLGTASLKQGSYSPAAAHFRKAIEIEPTYIGAYEGLIATYERANKPTEMARTITELLQIEPDSLPYRLKLAAYLESAGDAQRALAQYSLALRTDPNNADALAGFMRAAKNSGMTDRAAKAKARGHRLYPNDERFE